MLKDKQQIFVTTIKNKGTAPGRVAQLVGALFGFDSLSGHRPTHLGCGFSTQSGCVWEATVLFLSLSLPFCLSL